MDVEWDRPPEETIAFFVSHLDHLRHAQSLVLLGSARTVQEGALSVLLSRLSTIDGGAPRSLVFAREPTEAQAIEGLERIGVVPPDHSPSARRRSPPREWPGSGFGSPHGSAYLVFAEGLGTDLWTADRRLANNGRSLGIQTRFSGDLKDDPPERDGNHLTPANGDDPIPWVQRVRVSPRAYRPSPMP